jgi:hypothetical protein
MKVAKTARWEWGKPPEVHCAENPIYVFPEMKLRIVPHSDIHINVSDLYIPSILGIYKSLTGT